MSLNVILKGLLFLIFSITQVFVFSQNQKYVLEVLPVDSASGMILNKKKTQFKIKDSISALNKLEEIINKWHRQDYWLANIDSINFEGNKIRARLYLGAKFHINSILLDEVDANLLKLLHFKNSAKKSEKLTYKDFLLLRKRIVEYYENRGYPFVQISIDSLNFENYGIEGKLKIDKNILVSIDSILYKGNPKISLKYLNHYISIRKGDAYNQSKIDDIAENMDKLPYLSMPKAPEVEFRDNKADIYLYLKSKRSNYFNGILGFASSDSDDKSLSITGDVDLSLCNNFKIGETINTKWNKFGKASQQLNIQTSFPYIFVLPLGVDIGFGLEKHELEYLNTQVSASLSYEFAFKNKVQAYFKQKQTYIINNDSSKQSLKESKNFSAGIRFIYDATDYYLNPSKGYFLDISSGFGYRTLSVEKSQIADIELNTAYYLPLGKISTIALLNKSAAMFSNTDFYTNELYRVGGSGSLRGFDQRSIYASAYSIFSIEPRILLGGNSAVYAFMDYAWYEAKLESGTVSDTPFGFGLGINIDTKAGIFKIDFAMGKQFDNPIKFSDSKVHFGFSARF